MEKQFKFWNKYTKKEVQELWDDSLITFDTNVLLGLYRTSPKLSDLFFELSSKIKERIFIPHQVALEFHRNRYNIITDNYTQLASLLKEIHKFEKELKSSKFYNYLSTKTRKEIDLDLANKKTKITEREAYFKQLEKNDIIYSKLNILLKNKIENKPNEETIYSIYKEGKDRYAKKIPPGYEDDSKEIGKKFGDLLIWKEIISKSKKEKKDIIFITNEKKEDWLWVLKDKKRIGPRPELKEELFLESKAKFQISNLENYIFSIANVTANDIQTESIKKEFKFESLFQNNYLKKIQPVIENTEQNNELIKLQEEANNIQKMIEDIVSKPEIDSNQKQLLGDLRFRKNVIDETIQKAFSRDNK